MSTVSRAEWDTYTDEEKFLYVQLADKDNDNMREVLELIPECPDHGFCLPHMKGWIKARISQLAAPDTRAL